MTIVDNMRMAHSLAIGQDNLHYPYHVANKYFEIVKNNHDILARSQINDITSLVEEFNARFDATVSKNNNGNHPVMLRFKRERDEYMRRYVSA